MSMDSRAATAAVADATEAALGHDSCSQLYSRKENRATTVVEAAEATEEEEAQKRRRFI